MVEIGKKYNKLTVLELDHTDKHYHKFFKCRCDCGKEVVLRSDKIDSGKTKSCGCLNTIGRINDISGQRFGKITVLRPTERRSSTSVVWECKCDCGNEVVAADFKVDHIDERADRRECDLFSIEDPYNYFGKPDVLLHLAWRDGFVHYSDAHIDDLPKHYAFIKTFAESDVKMIAAMGSMHEIGFFEGSIKWDTPCNPTTPYGIAKNGLRQLTEMFCKQKGKKFRKITNQMTKVLYKH